MPTDMRTILQHIPVTPLVDVILDYSMDVRPIMNNVLSDIEYLGLKDLSWELQAEGHRNSLVPFCYRETVEHYLTLVRKVGSCKDVAWYSHFFKYNPIIFAVMVLIINFNLCERCENVNNKQQIIDAENHSVTQECSRCSAVISRFLPEAEEFRIVLNRIENLRYSK